VSCGRAPISASPLPRRRRRARRPGGACSRDERRALHRLRLGLLKVSARRAPSIGTHLTGAQLRTSAALLYTAHAAAHCAGL
jgi:hypothetical protein